MWDFIIKYWMEFAFGLVIAIFSFFFKRTMTLYKKEQKNEKDEFLGMIKKEISNEFEKVFPMKKNYKDKSIHLLQILEL